MPPPIRIRDSSASDLDAIVALYRRVAAVPGGLARAPDEITEGYVESFLSASLVRGLSLVAWSGEELAGEIHAYRPEPRVFAHVLGELTIAVCPSQQGRGVGRRLFTGFLDAVRTRLMHVERVELIARESNAKALAFYESIGFRREGRLERRIAPSAHHREADIPMAWFSRG